MDANCKMIRFLRYNACLYENVSLSRNTFSCLFRVRQVSLEVHTCFQAAGSLSRRERESLKAHGSSVYSSNVSLPDGKNDSYVPGFRGIVVDVWFPDHVLL